MKILNNTYFTFEDVLIAPAYSDIETRESVDVGSDFLGLKLEIPILSSNMDYVTGSRMAIAMWEAGGLGIIHRFCPWEAQQDNIRRVWEIGAPAIISVGIRDFKESLRRIAWVDGNFIGTKIVCIDVAHGYHQKVSNLIKIVKNRYADWKIIAGNVATDDAAFYLAASGADAIKVGIGPGSVCTTRIVTGVGVPQLSAIIEVARALKGQNVSIIADGGIRTSGDIVKALAAGADVVMLGHLLAGATESPGEVIETGDGRKLRKYRGQSIFGVNGDRYVREGVSGYVEEKGPVGGILKQLIGGLRSGMSYCGAHNLKELQEKTTFIPVSHHTQQESLPRVMTTF